MKLARACFVLALICSFAGYVSVQAKPAKDEGKEANSKLPLCPVMGEPINFYVSAQTKDGPVYFCCKKCVADYEKHPEKYSSKVEAQHKALHALPAVQVACPISGKAVNSKTTIDDKGHKVAFCCGKCPAEFSKNPEKYHAKMMSCMTYQTKCPVGGEEIDPSASTELNGQKVYFCCKKCIKEFDANPAKYAEKMEEQGYKLKLPKG